MAKTMYVVNKREVEFHTEEPLTSEMYEALGMLFAHLDAISPHSDLTRAAIWTREGNVVLGENYSNGGGTTLEINPRDNVIELVGSPQAYIDECVSGKFEEAVRKVFSQYEVKRGY